MNAPMPKLAPGYELTTDQARIDAAAAHAFLTRSYWSPGIPLHLVELAIAGSFCVAVRKDNAQVAFGRVITDYATFAWLADVHVLEEHRGQGLSKAMVAALQEHPGLQGLRRWGLHTADAQELYLPLGWTLQAHPERMMERVFAIDYGASA